MLTKLDNCSDKSGVVDTVDVVVVVNDYDEKVVSSREVSWKISIGCFPSLTNVRYYRENDDV
jgi:hypothetical protein